MKKFIKKFTIFLFVLPFFYICLVVIYGELIPSYLYKNLFFYKETSGFSYKRFKEVDTYENIDILFLGSSRSYRHYDNRNFEELGYQTFNLGSGGQTFLQTEVLVNRYLNQLNPKLVILDIYPGMFTNDGIESSLDIIINDENDKFSREFIWNEKNAILLNTWLFKSYKEIIGVKSKKDTEDTLSRYISGGFVERKVTYSEDLLSVFHEWEIRPSQWVAFEQIIQKIKKSNAKLILINSPFQSTIRVQRSGKLDKFLKRERIKFLDYSHVPELNDTLSFYDPIHLNQNGVEIFNKILIQDLFEIKQSKPSFK